MIFTGYIHAYAQRHISGTVTDTLGNPIFNANVMEIDPVNRIDNYTTTDRAGNFTMGYTGKASNYIFITADGYTSYHHRYDNETNLIKVQMKKRPASHLSELKQQSIGKKRKYVKTNKLLCGRSGLQEVPWTTLIEAINDTVFMLQLPVTTINRNATYPEGRAITFTDKNDYHILCSYNSEDAYPVAGNPADDEVWESMGKDAINKRVFQRDDFIQRTESGSYIPVYFYPQFLFTLNELQMICERSDRLGSLLVDTEAGDNYWNVYPLDTFGKELTRILNKLTKAEKKKTK